MTQLIEGFESPFGLLNCCPLSIGLSWNIRLPQRKKIIADTYAWGLHKKQFSKRQIRLALQVLREKDWLESEVTA